VVVVEHEGVLEELTAEDCVSLLSFEQVGRIAVIDDGFPLVFPVNYKVVAIHSEEPVIVIRTRPGNAVATAGERVAFEVDGVDHAGRSGWCVLVRGLLRHIDPPASPATMAAIDPEPWVTDDRDEWLALTPMTISGRRIRGPQPAWAFSVRGYL
jgi:nitroimidazol reductase NimA-like FMN-containing flavoprotein (pyridoxamine 5'-phosphate oxidase superfamily)